MFGRFVSTFTGEWLKDFFSFRMFSRAKWLCFAGKFFSELRVERACPTLMTASLTVEIVQLLLRTSCTFNYAELPHFVLT